MRTVDPDLWSRRLQKPVIDLARPMKYGVNEVSGLEIRLRESFKDAMAEYSRNCSLEGFGFVIDKRNPKLIRFIYLFLLIAAIICGLFVVMWNINWFWNRPRLMVNEQYTQHLIQRIDFPAVAICSYNIISRFALENYAKYLYSLDKNNIFSMEQIKQNLQTFGALHSQESRPFNFSFVNYLEEIAHETNITNILYKLSPKCELMLERCSWRAQRVRCQKLFATRLTNFGFCCVFNSRYTLIDRNNPPHKVDVVGQDAGLTVVVRENFDDFTSVRRLGDSVEVMIFDGIQFPLIRAGVKCSFSAARNASVFLKLNARAEEAANNLKNHRDEWLGCSMSHGERSVEHSWSSCIGRCRARATLGLCQCTPHILPPLDHIAARPCSLEHLFCLAKHKEKFLFLYPGARVHESLSEEQEDSVVCTKCLMSCARRHYSAEISTIPHAPKLFLNRFLKGLDLTNTTIISIYYESKNQRLFLVESGLRWYELIAIISCQCVFVVGLTVVSVIEFVYHCTFRWYQHYMRHWRRDRRLRKLKAPLL